ncbi:MAG: biotin--[acetyl-CoA-carboxylase] ligase [Syntrophomonadaceae bacterium]|jgi:BirA family biotin operon repressor/biotin-[acetyl-CoA-carboxylase] ligase
MRERILEELYKNRDQFISDSQLAARLQISQLAVWKQIEELRKEGLEVEAVNGKGYRIKNACNLVVPTEITRHFNNALIGNSLKYYFQVDSTNELIKRLNQEARLPAGTVVVAGSQTGGKGRRGRNWFSPFGGLWFSVILYPTISLSQVALLSLVCAVAVCRALQSLSYWRPMIKWPNDILVNNKKIAGILLEVSNEANHVDYVIVGIGINTNINTKSLPLPVGADSTSWLEENNRYIENSKVLSAVLTNLEKYYWQFIEQGFANILTEFKGECLHLGEVIKVKRGLENITGVNVDIEESGNLIIDTGAGIERITTGDVFLIGKTGGQGCI